MVFLMLLLQSCCCAHVPCGTLVSSEPTCQSVVRGKFSENRDFMHGIQLLLGEIGIIYIHILHNLCVN